ncbi:MAG: ribulose-bisphosphate carboxylase large subunit [bacterium]|nr:ribulose-bisphosphate carboxylase large subunit [bacterium]
MYGDYSYLHLDEPIDTTHHLVAKFKVKSKMDLKIVAEAIAAESSVGTWTGLSTMPMDRFRQLSAKVIEIDKAKSLVTIAYPVELWEMDNLAQLLSGIAGNVFGLKEIEALRVEDVVFPEKYVRYFEGPAFGVEGIKDYLGVYNRPVLGTIIKPKLGLTAKEHAEVAYQAWANGVDLVKDDENLTSQPFDNFYDRIRYTLELKKKAEAETGEKKIYAANATAQPDEMLRRAEFIKANGGGCVMLDILTAGLTSLEYLRKQDYNMIIHGHRAMHGAFTRNKDLGISMLFIAKLARLAGVDELHIGTVVGKMEGGKEEVLGIRKALMKPWFGIKKVMHVASGGLYPGLVEKLVKMTGNDVVINMGGGIHGHPGGTAAGARAARQAIELVSQGKHLDEARRTDKYPELKAALEKWGE